MSGLDMLQMAGAAYAGATGEQARLEDRAYLNSARANQTQMDAMKMEDAKAAHTNAATYRDALKGATDPVDAMTRVAKASIAAGDWGTYDKATNALASRKTLAYRDQVQGAMTQMQATGDPTALVNAFTSVTMPGHKTQVEAVGDGTFRVSLYGPDAKLVGAPKVVDGQGIINAARTTLTDPGHIHELYKAQIDGDYKLREIPVKGAQDRLTEGVKAGDALSLANVNNVARAQVAEGNNKATLGAAGISAAAHRYGADKTLEAAQYRVDNAPEKPDRADAQVQKAGGAIRYSLTGSNTMATMDPATQAVHDRALAIAGEAVRSGTPWEKAATDGLEQARKEVKLGKLVPGSNPGLGTPGNYSNLWN